MFGAFPTRSASATSLCPAGAARDLGHSGKGALHNLYRAAGCSVLTSLDMPAVSSSAVSRVPTRLQPADRRSNHQVVCSRPNPLRHDCATTADKANHPTVAWHQHPRRAEALPNRRHPDRLTCPECPRSATFTWWCQNNGPSMLSRQALGKHRDTFLQPSGPSFKASAVVGVNRHP